MPIGATACRMVVFSGFYESHEPPPSGDVHGMVLAHCDSHQNGQQSEHILHLLFVCCRPGGRRGDTESVVARWRRPVASGEALVMLHWAMTCSKVGVGGPAQFFARFENFWREYRPCQAKQKVYQLKKQNFNQNQPESQRFSPRRNWGPTVPW